jgi:hypothetical protein
MVLVLDALVSVEKLEQHPELTFSQQAPVAVDILVGFLEPLIQPVF